MFTSVTKLLRCLRINGGVPRHCQNKLQMGSAMSIGRQGYTAKRTTL